MGVQGRQEQNFSALCFHSLSSLTRGAMESLAPGRYQPPPPPPPPPPPASFTLGEGGWATVYHATQPKILNSTHLLYIN